MEQGEPTIEEGSGRRGPAALIEAMRPEQWVKNLFVLVAVPFSGRWGDGGAWAMAAAALAGFCLLSSAIYLVNDIADRASDLAHPAKRRRAVASARLSVATAGVAAAALLAAGAIVTAWIAVALYDPHAPLSGMSVSLWAGLYVAITLAYSAGLKGRPILDVLIVAMGFVLRAMAGAAAIGAAISPWLVICTFTLCLFIALGKRRSEIVALGAGPAGQTRRVHRFYTLSNLDHMLAVSAALALVTYVLYCVAPRTVDHVGSLHLIWTIPLVVYGMFRYYCLMLLAGGEDPIRLVLRDKVLWAVAVAWVALVVVVLKWGAVEGVRGILR